MNKYRNKTAGENILRTYDALLTQWQVPILECDVETRYGKTHVITSGGDDLPPLVLFHGVGDDSALMWIYNAKELSQHFKLYAIDTIGGPGKSAPNKNYNKDFDDILWIDDILTELKIESAFFAGVSHGGFMTQLYTLKRPEKVKKAIAISSSVPASNGNKNSSPMKTMMKIFLPEALFPTQKNTEKLIKKLSGVNANAFLQNKTIMEHYRFLLKGFNNMAMAYHKVLTFSDEEITQIKEKILYLAGEADPFQKLGGSEALTKYNMNVQFFEDAGHGLNHELASEINKKVIEYLEN